jgi:hypothetical protein
MILLGFFFLNEGPGSIMYQTSNLKLIRIVSRECSKYATSRFKYSITNNVEVSVTFALRNAACLYQEAVGREQILLLSV